MATIENLAPHNLKEPDANACLIEKLAASGAITEAERKLLLDMFRNEHQADRESVLRRARFAPPTNLHLGEENMNANEIVSQIEHTRSVMSAQIKKLNEFTPAPLAMPAAEAVGTGGLQDILVATVAGHIANAADSLRAIAAVETAMCAPPAKASVTESSSVPANMQVIDAQIGG
jgi:hypothetical protein